MLKIVIFLLATDLLNAMTTCSDGCSIYRLNGTVCSQHSDCTQTNCNCGSQNQCTSLGTFKNFCNNRSDCYNCKCSLGFCSDNCETFGTKGMSCVFDSDCSQTASCDCGSFGVCTASCLLLSGMSPATFCTKTSDCRCTCKSSICSGLCSKYSSQGKSCTKESDCFSDCSCQIHTTKSATSSSKSTLTTPLTSIHSSTLIQTTSKTTNQHTTLSIHLVPNQRIDFEQLSLAEKLALLTNPGLDVTPCLVNCTNNRYCYVNTQKKAVCTCEQYFTGPTCNVDIRPCSNTACLNGGICTNIVNDLTAEFTGYACNCSYPFHGKNCEQAIDLCTSKNCSGHGTCQVVNHTETECKCFSLYEGSYCQIESASLKATKTVVSVASIVAILSIISFYVAILTCDVLNVFFRCINRKKLANRTRKKFKPVYVPFKGDAVKFISRE